jgi:hypothetical protein
MTMKTCLGMGFNGNSHNPGRSFLLMTREYVGVERVHARAAKGNHLNASGAFPVWHSLQLCCVGIACKSRGVFSAGLNLPSFHSLSSIAVRIATSALSRAHLSFCSGLFNVLPALFNHFPTEIWHKGDWLILCIGTSALGLSGSKTGNGELLYHWNNSLRIRSPAPVGLRICSPTPAGGTMKPVTTEDARRAPHTVPHPAIPAAPSFSPS